MARTAKAKGAGRSPRDRGLKSVRLELPPDLHRALRIEAAKRDSTMSALARLAVDEFLSRAGWAPPDRPA